MKKFLNKSIILIIGILAINLLVSKSNIKWDLTADKHFTLSKATQKIIKKIDKPVKIIVFLEGEFPAYFKRLHNETKNFLSDIRDLNPKIDFVFINPLKKGDVYVQNLIKKGLQASQISVKKSGKVEQILVFPWAVIQQGEQEIPVSLLTQSFSRSTEEQIQKSIDNLEYAFTKNLDLIQNRKNKKIAILKGNGELDDIHLADFLRTLGKKYRLAPFTLDSVQTMPAKTLEELKNFDLAILPKPTEKFSEKEKYILDQYLMNGGKMLMLIDAVKAHKDTLMYHGKTYALNAELNLTDFLFNYGVRIQPKLIKDIVAAPVVLKVGQTGNKPQLEQFPWFYSPLIHPEQNHPIGKNVDMLVMDFVSPMDTLKNQAKKTILLKTSPKTELIGVPVEINFNEIGKKPDLKKYIAGQQIVGVLLEGKFNSAYKGRVHPVKLNKHIDQNQTALIVISDGDIIRNQTDKNRPLELGYDKWSKIKYDNKKFLQNAVDYLLDHSGVINLKNRERKLLFLDKNKIISDLGFWQIINTIVPLLILFGLIFGFNFYRKKKYGKQNF